MESVWGQGHSHPQPVPGCASVWGTRRTQCRRQSLVDFKCKCYMGRGRVSGTLNDVSGKSEDPSASTLCPVVMSPVSARPTRWRPVSHRHAREPCRRRPCSAPHAPHSQGRACCLSHTSAFKGRQGTAWAPPADGGPDSQGRPGATMQGRRGSHGELPMVPSHWEIQ